MTDEIPTRRSGLRGQTSNRRRRRRWPWVVGSLTLLLIFVGGSAVWLISKALTVQDELQAARPLLSAVAGKVLAGETSAAQGETEELVKHIDAASEAASGPVWDLGELVPGIGANLVAVRTITETVDDVVTNAVIPAVALGDALSPAVFKPVDGAVDLAAIQAVLPVLDSAGTALTGAKESVGALETEGLIGPVKDAVDQIAILVDEVQPSLAAAQAIAPVIPQLLGADGPRNYLLVFENSAEARPLGGIAGAQILVTADQGRVSIAQQTSGREFAFESEEFANSQVPREARDLFLVPFGVQSQNNTLTPRVDVAAQLTRQMWQNQREVTIDTVVFVDPTALSYILRSTGPLPLNDGGELTSENAIDVLLNGIYQKFAGAEGLAEITEAHAAQDEYFASAASVMFGAVMNGAVDVPKFIEAVTQATAERRMLANSTDPIVQGLIETAGMQGGLPQELDTVRQVGIYLSDFQGSKMDYYLRTAMQVGQATCADGSKRVRVQVDATNVLDPAAVDGLSIFVTGGSGNNFDIPLGDLRIFTYVYGPVGSSIFSINGTTSQVDSFVGTDQTYPVARGVIQVAPGQTQSSTTDIDVSALPPKDIEALVAPLIVQPEVGVLEFTC
jgi:hypothetical protein